MRHVLRAVLIISLLGAAMSAGALQVYNPASTMRGDAFSLFVPSSPQIRGLDVRLADPAGIVVNGAQGFPFTAAPGTKVWLAIVAVPSTVPAGRYRIYSTIATPSGPLRETTTILVKPRSFEKEDISLNAHLSRLQAENTRSKREQAALLWRMITTFRPAAVYATGPFIMPVRGYRVSSPYGARRFFVYAHGGGVYSVHQGVDLAIRAGTTVRAAGAGRVVSVRYWLMTGNTVIIEHLPEVYSLYFHLERTDVHPGEMVRRGQTIGLSGATGLATGPVLDYKVEVEGVAVDPMSLLAHGLIDPRAILARLR